MQPTSPLATATIINWFCDHKAVWCVNLHACFVAFFVIILLAFFTYRLLRLLSYAFFIHYCIHTYVCVCVLLIFFNFCFIVFTWLLHQMPCTARLISHSIIQPALHWGTIYLRVCCQSSQCLFWCAPSLFLTLTHTRKHAYLQQQLRLTIFYCCSRVCIRK